MCTDSNHKYFIKPFVGKNYEKGFIGYKTLVLGISHICGAPCPNHDFCHTVVGVQKMNESCPNYKDTEDYKKHKEYYFLSNSNNIEINVFLSSITEYPMYKFFTYYMLGVQDELTNDDTINFWNSIAFTNYLQIFSRRFDEIPKSKDPVFDENYPAFQEVLSELNPDIIFVWNPELKNYLCSKCKDLTLFGKTNCSIISAFIFLPKKSKISKKDLRCLHYRYKVENLKGLKLSWYEKLLKKCFKNVLTNEDISDFAVKLRDWVESEHFIVNESNLSFSPDWKTYHIGLFAKNVKVLYDMRQGANEGLNRLFGYTSIEKCSSNESKLKEDDKLRNEINKYWKRSK